MFTSYEEGGFQCHLGAADTTADALVGPRVPGLDLGDQQCAVGQQDQTVDKKQISFTALETHYLYMNAL